MSEKTIEVSAINPVDYYNQNCMDDCIEKLCEKPPIVLVGKKHLTYITNRSDASKKMLKMDKELGTFEAIMPNGFNIPDGVKLTVFQMLQKFHFKDNWPEAVNYVIVEIMKNEKDYLRVGTKYFLKTLHRDRYGIERLKLNTWDRNTIIDDYGKNFLASISKFKGFTMVPDNKNHTRFCGEYYNQYHPFEHVPMELNLYEGEEQWKWIQNLIKHIFGADDADYELGIRYLKILYDYPTQTLPILVLISKERQTGKTTFVNFMSLLFGGNTVVINPQDISNQFNASYSDKNVIMIEESHFDSRQTLEKIKNLSTQKELLVNTKHVHQYSVPFYGKLIITSNDENKFSKIDEEEIRYWVRKIPTLKGKANHRIMETIKDEIPAFLCYLNTLPDPDRSKDRMVFTSDEISTEALDDVKVESREALHKEILIYLDEHAENNKDVKEFLFTGTNIKTKWFAHSHNYGVAYVNKVLRNAIKFDKIDKSKRFIPLEENNAPFGTPTIIGRPYIFPNPYFGEELDDNEDIKDEDWI